MCNTVLKASSAGHSVQGVLNNHVLLCAVVQDTLTRSSMNLSDVADNVQGDWVILAQQLGITMSEINRIKTEYTTLADQALAMLQLWAQKNRDRATGKMELTPCPLIFCFFALMNGVCPYSSLHAKNVHWIALM